MHSGEQKVAKPELSFNARPAGIHVPQRSQRTNLLWEAEGVAGVEAVVALMSVTTFSDFMILLASLR